MVGIIENQHRFILHHRVMQQEVDVDIAVLIIQETKQRFPKLSSCSFDQGFHSPGNQRELADLLETVILPKRADFRKPIKRDNKKWCLLKGDANMLRLNQRFMR